jgi:hypothetical protein
MRPTCRDVLLTCIAISFCIIHTPLRAQAPDTLWTRTYGGPSEEKAFCVQQTSDNGYVLVGYTYSFGAGWMDFYLVRTDSLGDTLWTKAYGGTDNDIGRYVQQTSDGGYIVTGSTESFGSGSRAVWLLKTDEYGDTIWTKTFGWTNATNVGFSVQQTSDEGYIIGGSTQQHMLLIKTDTGGNAEWIREYGILSYSQGFSVQQTSDGGYVLAGLYYEPNHRDFYFVKTDALGDTLWSKRYGLLDDDECYAVQETSDGGYILVGASGLLYDRFGPDVFVVKTDTKGDTLWTRQYGGPWEDLGNSIQQTPEGGYIITGYTVTYGSYGYDLYTLRIDSQGDTIWSKKLNGPGVTQWGHSVQVTSDGGYIIAGWTSTNDCDVYLIKIAPDPYYIEENKSFFPKAQILTASPNPFQNQINIKWRTTYDCQVIDLEICDIAGRLVKDFCPMRSALQATALSWDGTDDSNKTLPSGVYFLKLRTEGYGAIEKLLLIR